MVKSVSRSFLLTGTDEPVERRRRLSAGALSIELKRGNLRVVRWGGLEVLRAIAFVVRDTRWGTYAPVLSEMEIVEAPDRFTVSYAASCDGPEGALAYRAWIVGSSEGRLRFAAGGNTPAGFSTNRSGFVVLHGLDHVVGRALAIMHSDGHVTTTSFPVLVSPDQPATDIIGLRHQPVPGVEIMVSFEGDAFEMEDQRNWTDASFKTYVRPLSRGFPYRIKAGDSLRQAVELLISGTPPLDTVFDVNRVVVHWGGASGERLPELGLYCDDAGLHEARSHAGRLADLKPRFLQVRLDLRQPAVSSDLDWAMDFADAIGCTLALDAIIAGRAPADELAGLSSWIGSRQPRLDRVFVVPARDLSSRPTGELPHGDAPGETILAAARILMPGVRLAGGMPVGFPELNRNRPAAGFDAIVHATQAIAHAADDCSVMETLEALPHVIDTVRSFAGAIPYLLGPCTIGMPPTASAASPLSNPDLHRRPMARQDPRQDGLFAAAFLIGTLAAARGVQALTPAAATGDFGVLRTNGSVRPIAAAFAGLAALSGTPRLDALHDAPGRLSAVAAAGPDGPVLWLANLSAVPLQIVLDGPRTTRVRLLDAEALASGPTDQVKEQALQSCSLTLDSYTFCCVY